MGLKMKTLTHNSKGHCILVTKKIFTSTQKSLLSPKPLGMILGTAQGSPTGT